MLSDFVFINWSASFAIVYAVFLSTNAPVSVLYPWITSAGVLLWWIISWCLAGLSIEYIISSFNTAELMMYLPYSVRCSECICHRF